MTDPLRGGAARPRPIPLEPRTGPGMPSCDTDTSWCRLGHIKVAIRTQPGISWGLLGFSWAFAGHRLAGGWLLAGAQLGVTWP